MKRHHFTPLEVSYVFSPLLPGAAGPHERARQFCEAHRVRLEVILRAFHEATTPGDTWPSAFIATDGEFVRAVRTMDPDYSSEDLRKDMQFLLPLLRHSNWHVEFDPAKGVYSFTQASSGNVPF